MLFTDPLFLLAFLPATLAGVGLALRYGGRRAGVVALVVASIVFYGHWRLQDVAVIVLSIAFNFSIALLFSREANRARLWILWLGIAANLCALVYYKYTNFILANLGHDPVEIILPLAISFYTFQQIAFIVDIYRGNVHRIPLPNYLVTVLFFPHLIAGPLIHYQAIMEQFEKRFAVTAGTIGFGLPIFAAGLLKKVVIADSLSPIVNALFTTARAQPLEFFSAWVAALGYTAQLYYDFSGYSDMAIGLGAMFGIALPLNFFSPYKAKSIIDFWRRWHMTLSEFLRSYLYIPLGGNKVSPPRRYVNLLIVIILGGLWHGAGWNFGIWGLLHGSYLVVNHLWRNNVKLPRNASAVLTPVYAALTFSAVVFAWVFFRASDLTAARNVFKGMAALTFASLPGELGYFFPLHEGKLLGFPCTGLGLDYPTLVFSVALLTASYLIAFLCPNVAELLLQRHGREVPPTPPRSMLDVMALAVFVGMAFWLASFGVLGSAPSEFLYFRF